ncbi:Retinoblastoma-associated protein A domain protein [Ancylostoma duodenale]|uniref:Retinoblastoma-associated protein A domain protein n=1 Tax=Ancylostoma duodenale TaxID=51022 RepID=A0A0C2DXS7_9BILA|nr:Retinoblastoma-associated protein A domain protein [Ancylostoma duodenale]
MWHHYTLQIQSQPHSSAAMEAADEVLQEGKDYKVASPEFEISDAAGTHIEEEVLDYSHEIPPPDEGYLQVCAAIDPDMPEALRDAVWTQLYTMSEKVDLDDETVAYVACAFYCVMLETEKFHQRPFPYSILNILKICSVSVMEFFDKLSRWIDIATSSKRIQEHSLKIQSSLAVSVVIFKKLLPIFRSLFQYVPSSSTQSFDSNKSLPSEDLLTCFHMMLCVVEWIYKDLCFHDCEDHIEQESVNLMMESKDGVRVLEVLCRSFDGVLLDAKHFRTHWFNVKRESILSTLNHKDLDVQSNYEQYLESLNEAYNSIMLRKGELDERMFIPSDIATVFDPANDSSAVELLRRGSNDSRFADAELLLTMSTQNCLEKLADVKRPPSRNDAKSYVISSQQLRPLCPMTQTDATASPAQKLNPLVPSDYKLEGSSLQRCCHQMRDNPVSLITLSADMMGERFVERVTAECSDREEMFDPAISQAPEEHREAMTTLFFVLVEKIILEERKRNPDRDLEGLLRKEEFLSAVFCCAMELVLFVQESERVFPWCLEVCGLPAVSFQKIIEVVVRNESRLTRDMVRHLNHVEERVLEELAWAKDSPLWTSLSRKPDSIPSCDEAWGSSTRILSLAGSPPKKMRYESDSNNFGMQLPPCNAQKSFFSKIYYLASVRLSDLCERIRIDDRGRRMIWTVLEYILKEERTLFMDRHIDQNLLCIVWIYYLASVRLSDLCERIRIDDRGRRMIWTVLEYILKEERTLFMDRHIDQNLLCIVYIVCKANKTDVSFVDIMAHYRHQPQSDSHIYRMVRVDSSVCLSNSTCPSEDGNSRDSTSGGDSQPLRSRSSVGTSPGASQSADGSAVTVKQLPTTPEPDLATGQHVDLIVYYNKVFLPRVEEFMQTFSDNIPLASLTPMPVRRMPRSTPLKRSLSDKVSVMSYIPVPLLQRPEPSIYSYKITQSPMKDLRAINQLIHKTRRYRFTGVTEIAPDAYRVILKVVYA